MTIILEAPSLKVAESLATINLSLQRLGENFAKGLDTVTRAIYETEGVEIGDRGNLAAVLKVHMGLDIAVETLPIQQLNQLLAIVVREKCVKDGFLAGWKCLVGAAPRMGLPSRLVEDVCIAANVYGRLKEGSRGRSTIDLRMSIGPCKTYDSIERVGPKSLGGNAWRASGEYMSFMKNPVWNDSGFEKGIPPCVSMGWVGIAIKVTPPKDAPEVVRMQLLGSIDFDLDQFDGNQVGFQRGFDSADLHTRAMGTKLQGAALIGMLNFDFQSFIRPIQNRWATANNGPYNLGPADVSPHDWTAHMVGDCAVLVPFAYDKNYSQSRTGLINGMIHLECQDLLFDAGCSNRVATVPYVEAAGVAKYGIHAAYAIAAYEATAKYFLKSLIAYGEGEIPPFGYSACVVAGPWAPYGTRYRVWERCVKYMRQLKHSKHPDAKGLLELVSKDLILKDFELEKEVGDEWERAMNSNASDLIPRPTTRYFVPVVASELFATAGVEKPELCKKCAVIFGVVMASDEKEEIHAMEGLPKSVTVGVFGRPASLAVGFRRAALWACGDNCCNTCACRIAYWVDSAAYTVLSALMHDEPLMGPLMWMMQNYFVGCVGFWPVGLPFLLSGFDLLADMTSEEGAMGIRDNVDI